MKGGSKKGEEKKEGREGGSGRDKFNGVYDHHVAGDHTCHHQSNHAHLTARNTLPWLLLLPLHVTVNIVVEKCLRVKGEQ